MRGAIGLTVTGLGRESTARMHIYICVDRTNICIQRSSPHSLLLAASLARCTPRQLANCAGALKQFVLTRSQVLPTSRRDCFTRPRSRLYSQSHQCPIYLQILVTSLVRGRASQLAQRRADYCANRANLYRHTMTSNGAQNNHCVRLLTRWRTLNFNFRGIFKPSRNLLSKIRDYYQFWFPET